VKTVPGPRPGRDAVNLAQDLSPGTALRVNNLVPVGTAAPLLYRPICCLSRMVFTQSPPFGGLSKMGWLSRLNLMILQLPVRGIRAAMPGAVAIVSLGYWS
jgi:hypothetical protein